MTIIGDATLIEMVSALGPLIIAVFAFLTYRLNQRLEKDNRRLRELEKEPHLVAYLLPNPRDWALVNVVIANVGKGPAFNVKISIDPLDYSFETHGVRLPQYKDTKITSCLPQGEKIEINLGISREFFSKPKRFNHKAVLSCENFDKIIKFSSYVLDVEVLKNMNYFLTEGVREIAKGVKEIAKVMKEISKGSRRVKVETVSKREVDKRHQEAMEKEEERQKLKNNG